MQEIRAGVLPWDFAGAPEKRYAYALLFCEEGQYAVCTPEHCISVLPGQCMLFRRSRDLEMPAALTGREQGGVLLLDPQRLEIPGVSADDLPKLPDTGYLLFANPRISTLLRELLPGAYSERMLEHKLAELFLLLAEPLTPVPPRVCKRGEFRIAYDAYQYAMEHLQERITIQELAARAGRSPTMIKLCFQHLFGLPAFAFLRREKMYRAAAMLRETDLRIIDIASRTGYDNCSKFSKAFADVMGAAPRAYRNSSAVRSEHKA
ncbi:MAG: helix-turn-helix transcriptional regulator [Oscillospiraceae bacterium]|nr:helix-turn-helix transcriptional regulator [Oscillospiraceae bacterium]